MYVLQWIAPSACRHCISVVLQLSVWARRTKSLTAIFNKAFCSLLTRQLSNLTLMTDRMVGCLSLITLKLNSASTLAPVSCFLLVDFILKTKEWTRWEHGNSATTLPLMSARALQRNESTASKRLSPRIQFPSWQRTELRNCSFLPTSWQ